MGAVPEARFAPGPGRKGEESRMEIGRMTMDDYESVLRLWTSADGVGLNPADDSEEGIGRYLQRNPDTCFVAREQGGVVGAILSGHDGRRGYLYHLAVDGKARRNGVGSALVQAAVEALRRQGIRKAALVAFEDNAPGNAFWAAQGFTQRSDLIYRNRTL